MRAALLLLALAFSCIGHAEFKPLFEANVVAAGGWVADYPGSEQHHFKHLIFPWGVYRGEYLRADSGGVQADIIKETAIGMDLSISGSLPTSSRSNDARVGMPNLDTMIELGPRLYLRLETEKGTDFRLNLPVRGVVSTNFKSTKYRGYLISPGLNIRKPFGERFGLTLYYAANFASKQMNEYFYEVAPEFVTTTRPAYKARGGYLGSTASTIVDYATGRAKYILNLSVQRYGGSANENSPLHFQNYDYSVVFGIVFTLYRSERAAFMPEPTLASSGEQTVR